MAAGTAYVSEVFPIEHAEFITITCQEWKGLLAADSRKDFIIDSFRFLVSDGRVSIFAFVIMSTHLHVIWQANRNYKGWALLRDFLKYTGQHLLRSVAEEDEATYASLEVNSGDRKFQVWKRGSLRIPVWSNRVFNQKLDYVHWNPVKAGLCKLPEQYKYSSAGFYINNDMTWEFLTKV